MFYKYIWYTPIHTYIWYTYIVMILGVVAESVEHGSCVEEIVGSKPRTSQTMDWLAQYHDISD